MSRNTKGLNKIEATKASCLRIIRDFMTQAPEDFFGILAELNLALDFIDSQNVDITTYMQICEIIEERRGNNQEPQPPIRPSR